MFDAIDDDGTSAKVDFWKALAEMPGDSLCARHDAMCEVYTEDITSRDTTSLASRRRGDASAPTGAPTQPLP